MLKELWNNYSWIVLIIGLIGLNTLLLKPTGKIITGFHRGANCTRKERIGDIAQGIIFLMFSGYIIYILISKLF